MAAPIGSPVGFFTTSSGTAMEGIGGRIPTKPVLQGNPLVVTVNKGPLRQCRNQMRPRDTIIMVPAAEHLVSSYGVSPKLKYSLTYALWCLLIAQLIVVCLHKILTFGRVVHTDPIRWVFGSRCVRHLVCRHKWLSLPGNIKSL
jgi:hypothetical protein